MNDLYLIGNGFDLAHGLKTSYNDFLLWYLNDFLGQVWYTNYFEDDLMKIIKSGNGFNSPRNFSSIRELMDWLARHEYTINFNHDFFKRTVENYRDYKWIDIEYEYYMALVEIYRGMEKASVLRSDFHFSQVIPLNTCFEMIKKKLVEYLLNIEIPEQLQHRLIENILTQGTGINEKDDGDRLFLNFNYTSTFDLYRNQFNFPKHELIYIHGKLNDEENPIIFGYGDEMDPHYEKIENLNSNDFLRNIKSFNYFKTNNYQKVIRFIEGEEREFTVKILGHSCGLSDRILLNTIFEHPNCKAIKIFHYEKSSTENDYFEKTQEISRHFKASKKGEMRLKIVPFDKYSKIPQNPKKN
jgi:hypothetical protein